MLRTDSMPRSKNTSLEQTECRFDGAGVNVALHVDADTVAESLVTKPIESYAPCRPAILTEIVRHQDFHVLADILADILLKRSGPNIIGMEEAEFPLPLPDANHDLLTASQRTAPFASCSAACEGFVHFDNATQLGFIRLHHCGPNAMAEVPSGLVGLDSERTLNPASAHASLCLTEQQCGEKPRHKRKVRIVEDRIDGDAKLVLA